MIASLWVGIAVMVENELLLKAPPIIVEEKFSEDSDHRFAIDVKRPGEHRRGRIHAEVVGGATNTSTPASASSALMRTESR